MLDKIDLEQAVMKYLLLKYCYSYRFATEYNLDFANKAPPACDWGFKLKFLKLYIYTFKTLCTCRKLLKN